MPSGTDDAIAALSHVVDELDPLYRPAAFLLGYAHLARGDSTNARRVLEPLRESLADAKNRAAAELRQGWVPGRPRLMRLAKRLLGIEKWLDYYWTARAFAIGGHLVLAADTWKRWKESANREESSLNLIAALVGDKELVQTAAGRRSSSRFTTDQARDLLDRLLDEGALSTFDSNLDSLYFEILGASVGWDRPRPNASDVDRLAQGVLARHFRKGLDKLRRAVADTRWEESFRLIEELRWYTRDASDYRFMMLLDDGTLDSGGARIASWFVPALRRLRKHREALREPLFLEAEYHLAVAELTSFEPELLFRAWHRAKSLRENRLPRSLPRGPACNLHLLTACIEVSALAALVRQVGIGEHVSYTSAEGVKHSERPDLELFTMKLFWERPFAQAARERRIAPDVRAAVASARGQLARYKRLDQARSREQRRSYEASASELLYDEMRYYDESLDLYATSTTHCYMAECLIELKRKDAALAHIRQALSLAPMHPLAKRLSDQLHSGGKG